MKRKSQKEKVREYLMEHGSITQLEATEKLGILRLSSLISALREEGVKIVTTLEVGNYNHFAKYILLDN